MRLDCQVRGLLIALAALLFFTASAAAFSGKASWYGTESGSRTATGEHFNGRSATCAHRTLPFGTILLVTNRSNGRSARCRVNDRGPARWTGRVLDVSHAVAVQLGMIQAGVVNVEFHIVGHNAKR